MFSFRDRATHSQTQVNALKQVVNRRTSDRLSPSFDSIRAIGAHSGLSSPYQGGVQIDPTPVKTL
jgi:hypothetical protein